MKDIQHRLPQLNDADLKGLPPAFAEYARRLSRGLHEMSRTDIQAVRDLDTPPVFHATRGTSLQSLSSGVLTTVQINNVLIDTHGYWDSSAFTYTPLTAGFYRCSWSVDIVDSGGAIATSTYAYSQLNSEYFAFAYGNGVAQDVYTSGAAIIDCDGSTTAITLKAFILAGVSTAVRHDASPYRTWLSIDYLGRRLVT